MNDTLIQSIRKQPDLFQIGGIFDSSVQRHELVQRAIDDHDPEKEAWAREYIRTIGDVRTGRGYFETQQERTHNLIPTAGLNFILNVLFFTTAKVSTWYHGPFISDWTPAAGAASNWAGGGSGPLATELSDAAIDESGRQAATFGTTAATGSIASSTATEITLATGQTGVTVYGTTLNSTGTIAYNSTDKVLIAATRFASAKSGLGAADKLNLSYTITAASS